MGQLKNFNIGEIIEKYNINYFIETGTGGGSSLEYSLNFKFDKRFSIELFKPIFIKAVEKFNNMDVILLNDNSFDGLKKIFTKYNLNKNILFWLDAHFPGADYGYNTYDSEKNEYIRIPLQKEIELISKYRSNFNDVFIIDDLRIYEDGPFKGGNWIDRMRLGGDGIDFIYKNLKNHNIIKNYDNEGYILCFPKNI